MSWDVPPSRLTTRWLCRPGPTLSGSGLGRKTFCDFAECPALGRVEKHLPFGGAQHRVQRHFVASLAQDMLFRDWLGDGEGKGVVELSEAAQWYLVDWWANERGEDIRRAPVRGFGVRPAWDCGDAYEYDRTNSRSPYQRIWNNGKPLFNLKNVVSGGNVSLSNGFSIPRFVFQGDVF